LESLFKVFFLLERLPLSELGPDLADPSLVSQLGAVVFAAVAGALLPALAFALGIRLFLALVTLRSAGRPQWVSALVTLAGVLFLIGSSGSFSHLSQEALGLGSRWLVGGA
jgi:hypothetical protein